MNEQRRAEPRTDASDNASDSAKNKERYWSRKIPPGRWDTIVIGSGMGGMTAAAMLAKLGKRVLVIEQHYVPGGFTHVFKRGRYEWDVGVHAVGEVTRHSLTGRLLAALTDDKLRWASLGPVYDEFYFPDGIELGFPDSPQAFREALVAAFPGEARGVDTYLRRVREVAGAMRSYYLTRIAPKRLGTLADALLARKARGYFQERTADAIAAMTDDPRLRTVLCSQWAYYGSTPSRSSFAMQALVTKHFLHGGYYPEGGSGEIARCLLRTVADAGGWTRIRGDVEEILVEGDAAVGVRLASGEELRASRVISAAGVMATVRRLLPPRFRARPWARSLNSLSPAPAHVCLYLGFKGDIRAAGAGAANKWFYGTWDAEFDAWAVRENMSKETMPDAPVLYCSFPSLKDPRHDPGAEQRHTGEVVTFVPWSAFERWRGTRWHKRGDEYEAFKSALQEHLLAQFLARMPGLRPLLDHVELSTPVSTDHFVRPTQGSIYGIEPTPERFANPWLRPRSPIKNLYFAGSEVSGVGVIGAMM
ncbi:MAG: NAD(P)/FAD-dependent oxidoreductase, partial [Myxococcales bacterium]|nr:NAD(P)/FAD-dependent oxidoreductase [Myxococcales bacterium]